MDFSEKDRLFLTRSAAEQRLLSETKPENAPLNISLMTKEVLASEIKKGIVSFNTEKTFSLAEVQKEIAIVLKTSFL